MSTAEHTDNSDCIGQQVTSCDLVETTQVGESRSSDLAAVRPLASVTDDVDTHLTLRGLDGRVRLTGWDSVALGEEKEVVDEGLHVLLHGGARRRADLVVLHLDRSGGHLVQALVDDSERLAELLHPAQVTVIAVTVDTDGNVEFDLVVGIVWLRLANIPRHTGATQHDTREAHVQGFRSTDHSNTLGSGLPDPVVRQQFFRLVNSVAKLSGPLVDIIEQTERQILRNTAGADIGGMKTSTRNTLVEFL
jgi:hypothetical protein